MRTYKIAKYTTQEIVLDAQLMSAGSNQSRILERFDEHKKSLRYQLIVMKVVYTFVFGMVSLLPFFSYQDVFNLLMNGNTSHISILFAGSIVFTITFGIQFLYLFLLGLFNVSSMMSGDVFRWLETLPFSKETLRKIGFMTLFRSFDLPIIATITIFPIMMLIRTLNLVVFCVCLIISILNILFSFSLLILIGERLNRIMNLGDLSSKKATFIRIFSMLSYVAVSFGTAFILQWAFSSVNLILQSDLSLQSSVLFNVLLSIIPFPFASGYLVALVTYTLEVPIELWISPLIGLGIFTLITLKTYKSALNSLRTVTSSEIRTAKRKKKKEVPEEIKVEIEVMTPIRAYLRKDLTTATRDIQTLMYLIMPFIFPFLFAFPIILNTPESLNFIIIWGILILITPFISLMLTSGLLGMEESGATLLASLPIIPRDQAFAKLYLIFLIQTLSFLIQVIIFITYGDIITYLLLIPASLPVVWTSTFLAFIIRVRFFGKLKYKYVVEDVHPEKKILKWILTIILIYLFDSIYIVLGAIVNFLFGFIYFLLLIVGFGALGVLLMYLIFNRMFPHIQAIHERKRNNKKPSNQYQVASTLSRGGTL